MKRKPIVYHENGMYVTRMSNWVVKINSLCTTCVLHYIHACHHTDTVWQLLYTVHRTLPLLTACPAQLVCLHYSGCTTGCTTNKSEFGSRHKQEIFLVCEAQRKVLVPQRVPSQKVQEAVYERLKRPGPEAYCLYCIFVLCRLCIYLFCLY